MPLDKDIFGRQLFAESNNRQFNPDGTVVRSPKGATGIAQVMPDTGPEAARYAKVAWDPVRFEKDSNYNRLLGEAYKAKMLEIFGGDERKATAAYNAGPGDPNRGGRGVRGAMRRAEAAGSKDWEKFLPKETQGYLTNVFGGGRRVATGKELDGQRTFAGVANQIRELPESDSAPVVNPFAVGPEMRERADRVESELAGQQAFIQRQQVGMEGMQAERRARLETVVAEKQGLLDEVQRGNRALLDNVKPLLQREQRVSDRLAQLATMNPLEKGLRGVFDLNFNEKYLRGVHKDLITAIQDQGQRYQFTTTLQEQYMNSLDMESKNAETLESLVVQEFSEDGAMANQALNSAMASFGALNTRVQANDSTIRAQILARSNYLEGLDAGQLNSLREEAANSPDGKIRVEGITVGKGELDQRVAALEQQDMSLRSAKLSLQHGELQLADANARHMVSTMTESQLQEAAANNGQYRGIQLPSDAITAGLADYAQRKNLIGNTILQQGGDRQGSAALRSTIGYVRNTRERMQQFGRISPEMNRTSVAIGQRIIQLSDQLDQAIQQGQGDTVGQAIVGEVQKLQEQFDKSVQQTASRYAGGSELGGKVMTAYLRGEQIQSNESIPLMQEYAAQGGLPAAMRTSPTFQVMFNAVQQATAEIDTQIQSGAVKATAPQRQAMIVRRVRELGPNKVNSANFEQMFSQIPETAKAMNHPFAVVSKKDFLMAQQQGNAQAMEVIANKIGIPVDQAIKLFGGTYQAPPGQDPRRTQEIKKAAVDLKGELQRVQREGFLIALDQGPAAKDGFRPSEAFIDLMDSNAFHQRVGRFQELQKNFSFGDSLAASMGDGNLVQTAVNYGTTLRELNNGITANQYRESAGRRLAYTMVPTARTQAILGAIEGLQQSEEQLLIAAIKQSVPNIDKPASGIDNSVNESIRNFIVANKFKDPNLERIRKVAAQNWDTTAKQFDRAMFRMKIEDIPIVGPIAGSIANALGSTRPLPGEE